MHWTVGLCSAFRAGSLARPIAHCRVGPKPLMIDARLKSSLEPVQNLAELAEHLERFLNSGCYIWFEPNGERLLLFGRALVDKIRGLKIHIYPDEHAPPHFHVVAPGIDAAFSIADCSLIKGSVDSKTRDLIVYWYGAARPKLVEVWNNTRPTGCPVGPIHDDQT